MKACVWIDGSKIEFNPQDICYVLFKDGFDCETHFSDGNIQNFYYNDMEPLLKELAAVDCYGLKCKSYINKNHIVGTAPGQLYEVKFSNGEILKNLSGLEFEKNVILNRKTPSLGE